jgi:hypothetical protein
MVRIHVGQPIPPASFPLISHIWRISRFTHFCPAFHHLGIYPTVAYPRPPVVFTSVQNHHSVIWSRGDTSCPSSRLRRQSSAIYDVFALHPSYSHRISIRCPSPPPGIPSCFNSFPSQSPHQGSIRLNKLIWPPGRRSVRPLAEQLTGCQVRPQNIATSSSNCPNAGRNSPLGCPCREPRAAFVASPAAVLSPHDHLANPDA